jgi:hypothetical protein
MSFLIPVASKGKRIPEMRERLHKGPGQTGISTLEFPVLVEGNDSIFLKPCPIISHLLRLKARFNACDI